MSIVRLIFVCHSEYKVNVMSAVQSVQAAMRLEMSLTTLQTILDEFYFLNYSSVSVLLVIETLPLLKRNVAHQRVAIIQ